MASQLEVGQPGLTVVGQWWGGLLSLSCPPTPTQLQLRESEAGPSARSQRLLGVFGLVRLFGLMQDCRASPETKNLATCFGKPCCL